MAMDARVYERPTAAAEPRWIRIGDQPWSSRTLVEEGQKIWQLVVVHRAYLTAATVFVVAMTVYLETILLGPAFFDTAEYQVAPYVLGNMHQTGYPLHGVVGKIFGTLVPIGSFGYRMNLMSAVFLATMASFLVFIALRYRVSAMVALAAGLSFALEKNVWGTALHADPHPLTALIAASLWLMALKWRDTGDRRWLWSMSLLSGVGLGGAAILVSELPAIIFFALISRPREAFAPKTAIVAALLGPIGLVAIYSYLPIRAMMHAPLNYWDPETWIRFQEVVLSGGGGLFTLEGWRTAPQVISLNAPLIVGWYAEWLTPAGRAIVAILSITGLFTLLRRDWRIGTAMVLGVFLPMYAAVFVPNMDRGRYFMMTNWLLFFLSAVGAQTLLIDPLRKIDRGSIRQSLIILLVGVCLMFPSYLAHSFWNPKVDHDNDGEVFIDGVFAALKPNAVLLSWWGASTTLWYGHFVEGKRPDIIIFDDSESVARGWPDLTSAIDLYYGKRPVYAVSWPDELDRYRKKYKLRKVAQLDWFGMTVNEVVGPADTSSKAAP